MCHREFSMPRKSCAMCRGKDVAPPWRRKEENSVCCTESILDRRPIRPTCKKKKRISSCVRPHIFLRFQICAVYGKSAYILCEKKLLKSNHPRIPFVFFENMGKRERAFSQWRAEEGKKGIFVLETKTRNGNVKKEKKIFFPLPLSSPMLTFLRKIKPLVLNKVPKCF